MVINPPYPRLLRPPDRSFFLFGPRGSGKTTWLKETYGEAKHINLLDEALYQSYLANPTLFYASANGARRGQWVVVDEIQRLPGLLNEVHRLMEEQKIKFALTGSSARKLKRNGVNLLAGRAVRRSMYPLSPQEMGEDFDLDRVLRWGSLPLVVASDDPADTLKAYSQMYLKEEIQGEALVRNLPGFSRFLPVAGLFHGQVLNISNVARDAGVSRTTAQDFFEILEDTLLAHRLPAFESNLRVREKRHPKFYWIDPGVVRAIRKEFSTPNVSEQGALFEGLIHMLLCLQQEIHGEIDEITYWSPAEAKQTEVDFVLKKGKEYFAIEVKSTATLRPEHWKGLKTIAELRGMKRRILVYRGQERLALEDGIEVLPFSEFVDELRSGTI